MNNTKLTVLVCLVLIIICLVGCSGFFPDRADNNEQERIEKEIADIVVTTPELITTSIPEPIQSIEEVALEPSSELQLKLESVKEIVSAQEPISDPKIFKAAKTEASVVKTMMAPTTVIEEENEPVKEPEVELEEVAEPVEQAEAPAPTTLPSEDTIDVDVMCLSNMVFHEIGGIIYDSKYTDSQIDLAMQEWASVAINHLYMGTFGDSIPEVISAVLPNGYYVWHPQYTTEWYMNQCIAENAALYERCCINASIALSGAMAEPLPSNVIYADCRVNGSGVYKTYDINTGYFHSVVYLCYG